MTKRVALYGRISTDTRNQTVENQLWELRAVGVRLGWMVVGVYTDEGVSGAKGRDKRARREFDLIAARSVCRLGRSLQDLIGFLDQARGVVLYLHQQALDTSTPSGPAMFQLLGVFASGR
jgi:DNA invertase Pin-like site-specific DNA recombinase